MPTSIRWITLLFYTGATIMITNRAVYGQLLTCDINEVKRDSKNCTREFIDGMVGKVPLSNCSEEFKKMHSCVHDIVFKKCFKSLVSRMPALKLRLKIILDMYLRSLTNLDVMFCGQVVGEKVNVSNVPSNMKQFIPCKQEAFTKGPACALDFFTTFKANKTDPSLCRKYIKAKECELDVRKTYCKKEMVPDVDPIDAFCTAAPDVHGGALLQHTSMVGLAVVPFLLVFKQLLV